MISCAAKLQCLGCGLLQVSRICGPPSLASSLSPLFFFFGLAPFGLSHKQSHAAASLGQVTAQVANRVPPGSGQGGVNIKGSERASLSPSPKPSPVPGEMRVRASERQSIWWFVCQTRAHSRSRPCRTPLGLARTATVPSPSKAGRFCLDGMARLVGACRWRWCCRPRRRRAAMPVDLAESGRRRAREKVNEPDAARCARPSSPSLGSSLKRPRTAVAHPSIHPSILHPAIHPTQMNSRQARFSAAAAIPNPRCFASSNTFLSAAAAACSKPRRKHATHARAARERGFLLRLVTCV